MKISHAQLASVLACLLLCTPLLLAQTHKLSPRELPPSAFKLIAIKVTGIKTYTEDQVIGQTGLRLGQTTSEDDFKAASRALGETGAFTDVLYSFQYSTQGTKLAFQVTENDQLVPARFDNFVWFSDSELMAQLRTRVPLFQGKLPVAGGLADQVSDALQTLLIEKNVPGRADYLRSARDGGPIDAFIYKVTGPAIHIHGVKFDGVSADELPALDAMARRLTGSEYMRSILSVQAEKNFLPVYLARGYLKAAFAESQAKIAEQNSDEVLVDITFPANPGRQYSVSAIQLAGANAFPVAKLQELIHQPIGKPANAVQLDADVEAIKKLYGSRGYMEASVKAPPEIDDAQATVKYQLEIHEGDVYKMGDLDIQGLDSRTTPRLVEEWKLTGNDPYDSAYLKQFVQQALKEVEQTGDWKVAIHETINQKDKTVDVTLRFDPK